VAAEDVDGHRHCLGAALTRTIPASRLAGCCVGDGIVAAIAVHQATHDGAHSLGHMQGVKNCSYEAGRDDQIQQHVGSQCLQGPGEGQVHATKHCHHVACVCCKVKWRAGVELTAGLAAGARNVVPERKEGRVVTSAWQRVTAGCVRGAKVRGGNTGALQHVTQGCGHA